MERLREELSTVFPKECFLQGTRIEERKRVFSIRPEPGEAVIGLKLNPLRESWPEGKGICDGLFVCLTPNTDHLIVTLVELKGSDVVKALGQIRDTCLSLCKAPDDSLKIHSVQVRNAIESLNRNGHGKRTLGVIVGRSGLPLDQKEKKETVE